MLCKPVAPTLLVRGFHSFNFPTLQLYSKPSEPHILIQYNLNHVFWKLHTLSPLSEQGDAHIMGYYRCEPVVEVLYYGKETMVYRWIELTFCARSVSSRRAQSATYGV